MRAAHLVRRFFGSLRPGPPRAADVAWVRDVLPAGAFALWDRMPNADRRHSVVVARRVERALAGTEYANDPRWLAAALLHDVGKVDSGLRTYGRVVATLAAGAAGRENAEVWSTRRGFTRRVGLYVQHPRLGADMIRVAGGPEEAAIWAAAHHEAETWDATGIPRPVVDALESADDD
ncbi:MAG TPA: HD domain-containing protein [Acidimicrobiia bacterium]|nr:HD domain-containing protein [Acidimicrobiia bacterium]